MFRHKADQAELKIPFSPFYEEAKKFDKNQIAPAIQLLQQIEKTINAINERIKKITGSEDKAFYFPIVLADIESIERQLIAFHQLSMTTDSLMAARQSIIEIIKKPLHAKRKELTEFSNGPTEGKLTQQIDKTQALYCQQAVIENDDAMKAALTATLTQIAALPCNRSRLNKSCFISYAWPLDEFAEKEAWLQPFLRIVHRHLTAAGICPMLDIVDNRAGKSIYQFIAQAETSEFSVLICTESLYARHHHDKFVAVKTELNHIQRKHDTDSKHNQSRIIPYLLSGPHHNAYPEIYKMYSTVQDWRDRSYIENLKSLVSHIYYPDKEPAESTALWESFYAKYPFLAVPMPENTAKQSLEDQYHEGLHQALRKESFYATLLTQYSSKEIHRLKDFPEKTLKRGDSVETKAQDKRVPLFTNDEPFVFELRQALKDAYQKRAVIKRLYDAQQLDVMDSFINLQLVEEKRQKIEEQRIYTTARQQAPSYEDIYQPKGDIISPDELQIRKGKSHQILIVGRAGIGKTTVCQYYAARWSTKEKSLWHDQFDWVFWIALRDLTNVDSYPKREKPYELMDLVQKHCFSTKDLEEKEFIYLQNSIKKTPDRILWILDGYDEISPLNQRVPHLELLLKNRLLTQPYVIITARPHAAQEIKADTRLENVGFTKANIQAYINRFFETLLPPNVSKGERLSQFLAQHNAIQSLAHIPICLELICSIWQAKLAAEWQKSSPIASRDFTLTHLYEEIVEYYLRRYLGIEETHDWLPAEVYQKAQPTLYFLEQLAMDGLRQDTLELGPALIQQALKSSETKEQPMKELLESGIRRIGLLKPLAERTATLNCSYYFVHLSFQEYLAARYLHRWLNDSSGNNSFPLKQNSSTDTNAWQWIAAHSGEPRYENLWTFVASLLRHHLPQLEIFFDHLLAGKTNEALLKEDSYRLLLTLRCLEACNLAAIPQRERLLKLYLTYAERILLRYVEGTAPVLVKLQATYQQLITYLRISPQVRRAARIDELLNDCSEEKSGSLFAPKFDFNMPISTLAKQQAFLASLDLETQNEGLFKSLAAVIQDQTQRYDLATQERAIRRLGSLEIYHNGTPDLLRQAAKQPRLQPAALTVAGKLAPQDHLLIDFLIEALMAPGLSRVYALRELQNLISPLAKQAAKTYAVTHLEEVINAQLTAAEKKLIREQPQVWEVLGWLGQLSLPNFTTHIEQTLLVAAFDESKIIKEASIAALKQLGKAEDAQLLHFLIRVYGDFAKTHAQQQIAEVLMSLSGTHVVELLLAYLKEPAAVVSKPEVLQLLTQFEYPEKDSAIMVALEESCLSDLKDEDSAVKHAAAIVLGRLGRVTPAIRDNLFLALWSTNHILQENARKTLTALNEHAPALMDPLLGALLIGMSSQRKNAIEIIKNLGSAEPRLINALLQKLEDPHAEVQKAAAAALYYMAKAFPEVTLVLLKALEDKKESVRRGAADALGEVANASPEVVLALLKALEDKEWIVRWAAADALSRVANVSSEAVPALLKALENTESHVRRAAANALGKVVKVSPEVVPALRKVLEDKESSGVRWAAANALGQVANASPEAVPALLKALESKESDMRWAAVNALGKVEKVSPEAVPALLKALESKEGHVRQAAAAALGQLANASPEVVLALRKALEDKESSGVRRAAVEALGKVAKVSPEAVPALLKALESNARRAVVNALDKVEKVLPKAMLALLKALEDKESHVRQAAAVALGKVANASPEVVLALRKALEDKGSDVRRVAVEALEKRTNTNPHSVERLPELPGIDTPVHGIAPTPLAQSRENNHLIKAFIHRYYNTSTKHQEINVPDDNNCLFWSAALALLLPVLNDNKAFLTTYERLFGTTGSITLENKRDTTEIKISDPHTQEGVQAMLRTYDCQQNTPLQFQSNAFGKLVCHVFRNRVVDQMEQKWDEATKESIRIESGKQDWKSYATGMRALTGWGGEPEIRAISQLMQVNIQVSGQGYRREYKIDGANTTLYLMHANAEKAVGGNNHYHFGLHNDLYQAQIKPFSSSRLLLGNPVKDTTTATITSSHVPATENPARFFTPVGSTTLMRQTNSAVDIANQPHRSYRVTTRSQRKSF